MFVDIKLNPKLRDTEMAVTLLKTGKYFFVPRGKGVVHPQPDGTGRIDEVKLFSYDLTDNPAFNCAWDENGNQVIV